MKPLTRILSERLKKLREEPKRRFLAEATQGAPKKSRFHVANVLGSVGSLESQAKSVSILLMFLPVFAARVAALAPQRSMSLSTSVVPVSVMSQWRMAASNYSMGMSANFKYRRSTNDAQIHALASNSLGEYTPRCFFCNTHWRVEVSFHSVPGRGPSAGAGRRRRDRAQDLAFP